MELYNTQLVIQDLFCKRFCEIDILISYLDKFLLELHLPSSSLLEVLDDVLDVLLHEELERRRRTIPDQRFSSSLFLGLRQVTTLRFRAGVMLLAVRVGQSRSGRLVTDSGVRRHRCQRRLGSVGG